MTSSAESSSMVSGMRSVSQWVSVSLAVTAILKRLSKSGLIRNPLPPQKISHHCIEPGSLVPLHPMGAVVEQMEFSAADPLKQFEATLHRNPAILVAP